MRWLSLVVKIIRNFYTSYFDCKGAFQTVFDSYCPNSSSANHMVCVLVIAL